MIACHSLGFIFIKTRKTAGTSAEAVLSSWCGEGDICTPISAADEPARQALGGRARGHLGPDGARIYTNHMPAAEVRQLLPDLWSRAFKFTIERHPYEKVVSRAWWNLHKMAGRRRHARTFEEELEAAIADRSYLNYPLYCADGTVVVDEVIDHAALWPRLGALAGRWGVALPSVLPTAKAGHRQDRRPATDVLTAEQKAQIATDAAFEFDLMGYRP